MSRGITLSVLGLYKFNNHLFDNMILPSGFTASDRETVIGNILAQCAELEILYPDWDFCKEMIGLWSKFRKPEWDRLYKAQLKEYNPIENYNRTEIETTTTDMADTHSGNDTRAESGSDTQLVKSNSTETNSGTDSTGNSITSYDSNQYQPHDKSDFTHGHKVTDDSSGNTATMYGKNETFTHGEKISREGEITRENHTTGNIGVMSSQTMLLQEIEVSAKLNIFNTIVTSFKDTFCLLVY